MPGRSGELKGSSSKREWVRREEEGEERDKAKDTQGPEHYINQILAFVLSVRGSQLWVLSREMT